MKKELIFIICSLFLINFVSAAVIGEWKINEGSGTTIYDSSGNGNDGTLTIGSGQWVNGNLLFDGTILTIPYDSVFDYDDYNYAIVMKFYITDWSQTAGQNMFLKYNNQGHYFQPSVPYSIYGYHIQCTSDGANGKYVDIRANFTEQTPSEIENKWHEFKYIRHNQTDFEVIIDGVSYTDEITNGLTDSTDDTNSDIVIGEAFAGYIKSIRICDTDICDYITETPQCTPNCNDKTCGDDGCGGSCGTCLDGFNCNSDQKCISNGLFISGQSISPVKSSPVSNLFNDIINWFKNLF